MKKYIAFTLTLVFFSAVLYGESAYEKCRKYNTQKNCEKYQKGAAPYVPNVQNVNYHVMLLDAVKSNNIQNATNAIAYRGNIEQKIDEYPLVTYAIKNSYTEMAMLLIDKGADVNAGDKNKTNALHWAAWMNYTDIVEKCLQKRADINLQIYDGSSALMLAVFRNNNASVDILLRRSPNLNLKNTSGKTAVMLAVEQGFPDMAVKLANHGANLNLPDNDGRTPLMIACRRNIYGTSIDQYLPRKLLNLGAKTSPQANDGSTALKMAISSGAFDAAVVLMENGALE